MVSNEWQVGGCFCRDVRYHVRGESPWQNGCTCNTCVKMHGAPYVVWAGFDRSNFEFIQGSPTQFYPSKHAIREFCRRCGCTTTYGKEAQGVSELEQAAKIIYVAVAALDNPEAYPPNEVVHTREEIRWLHLGDEIPLREFISPDAAHLQFGGIDNNLGEKRTDQSQNKK